MKDQSKSKEDLLKELEEMNKQVSKLGTVQTELKEYRDQLEKTAQELRSANTYNRSLIEASLDLLVTISPEGKVTDVNEATIQVTGVSREHLIGSDFSDYFTEPDKARAGYKKVLSEGLVKNYPLTIRHTSGRMIDVLYNASVYRNEAGEVQGVFATARDITEIKKVEKARALAAIVESSEDAIIGKGLDGTVLSWNSGAERTYGYSAREMVGKSISILTPPDHPDEVSGILRRIGQGEYIEHYETIRIRKDGQRIDVSLTISPIKDESGRITGASTIGRDITESKRKEETIRRQTQEILELSTPVIQVWQGVVVAPLIGTMDSARTQRFMERFLNAIVNTNSSVALVDITGVPTIDTQTAQHLIEAISSAQLLGTKVVLTGVRPAIAQTLVHLGIDLSEIDTRSSLSAGLRVAFDVLDLQVVNKTKINKEEE